MPKEALNRKILFFTNKLNVEFRNKLVLCLEHCFLCFRKLDTKKNGTKVFGEIRNVVLEKNGVEKVTKDKFLNL